MHGLVLSINGLQVAESSSMHANTNAKKRKLRFLVVGGWNTLFGYSMMVYLSAVLSASCHVIVIATIANIIGITMSFVTYKLLVFRARGRWLVEYAKAYVVYGANALVTIALLWALIDGAKIDIFVAQAMVTIITVVLSYFGHSRLTFHHRGEVDVDD